MDASGAVSLLVLALGAFLIPLLSERIHIPGVVGEILFGMAIGPYVLGLLEPTAFTRSLAEFGFAFLMFLAGLEIDFTRIGRMGRKAVLACLVAALGTSAIAAGFIAFSARPLFLVLVVGAMSLGLVMATLRGLGLSQRPIGQVVLLVGTFGEFVTLILLTAGDITITHGIGLDLAVAIAKLALVFGLAWICLVILRTLIWWYPASFSRVVTSNDPAEIGVRAGLALMLSFVALAALLGVEMILGAFLAGALFSFVFREKHAVETKLASIGFGFFIPIFFIDVGMGFDLGGLADGGFWDELGFIAAASMVAKLAPCLLLVFAGLKIREVLAGGLLLAAPLTLLVAVSRIGLHAGAIDEPTAFAVVLFAIIGGVVLPILFRLVLRTRPPPAGAEGGVAGMPRGPG